MLQQTQAGRVSARFAAFLRKFPEPQSLAEAGTAAALDAWSGLGYNRRVLRLRAAAQHIVARGWPTTAEGLRELPGVGEYTAAAVACFAFGHQVPALDTNLRRVLSRWLGRGLHGQALRDAAVSELPEGKAVEWNQAVMDLGAVLCRPTAPDCGACPVARCCADPGVYVAPRRQPAFAGSVRQARGAVLRELAQAGGSVHRGSLVKLDLDAGTLDQAVAALATEGIVALDNGFLRLT